MNIVMFDYTHNYDMPHEFFYVDADSLGEKGIRRTVEDIQAFKPDLIIERQYNDNKAIYTEVYEYLNNIPKAMWTIDAHVTLAEHINYAKQFDYIFCAQSWFLPRFKHQVKGQLFWLPLCHTQTMTEYITMLETPVERTLPLTFIGNIRSLHVERKQYVERLIEMFGTDMTACTADYDQTIQMLRQSKITFNCSLNDDLNFRVWEAIACGTPIVTDDVYDLNLIDGVEDACTTYDKLNPDFSVFQHPKEPVNGISFIKSGHTLTHRYNQMLEMITTGRQHVY